MASAYLVHYKTKTGKGRWRVRYRIGGADTASQHGGSFLTKREADARRNWIAGELAAMRVPNLQLVVVEKPRDTLRAVAEIWRASMVDVSDRTARNHRGDLARVLPTLGDHSLGEIGVADVVDLVAELHKKGLKRQTIRKTLTTLGAVFEFRDVVPNPVRDKKVRLPREEREEVNPPTATHVLAARVGLPLGLRLPMLVLDATGMRVGELEALTWGDVDELAGRWRVRGSTTKTGQARWVPVPPDVFAAVAALVPREDRDVSVQVFAGFGADRFRTALTRACKTAGVPAFSPHDLRHRRATMWHLSGVPAAEAAAWLGHSPQEHLRTYAHATLVDREEVDYGELLGRSKTLARARMMSHP